MTNLTQDKNAIAQEWDALMELSWRHREELEKLTEAWARPEKKFIPQNMSGIISSWRRKVICFLQTYQERCNKEDCHEENWYLERVDLVSESQLDYIKRKIGTKKLDIQLYISSARELLNEALRFTRTFEAQIGGIFGELHRTDKLYQEKQTSEYIHKHLSYLNKTGGRG